MNKNTLIAFVLLMAAMTFIMSPSYEKIYRSITGQKEIPVASKKIEKSEESIEIKNEDTLKMVETTVKKNIQNDIKRVQDSTTRTTVIGDTIWIETEKMIAGIMERGANIISIKMKEYRIDHNDIKQSKIDDLVELIPSQTNGGCGITINTKSFDLALFKIEKGEDYSKTLRLEDKESKEICFIYKDPLNGDEIKKIYIFEKNSYKIGLKIISNAINGNRLTLSWQPGIFECEQNKIGFYSTEERKIHYSDYKNNVSHIKATKIPPTDYENPESGIYRWIGISSKYFLISMIAEKEKEADLKVIAFEEKKKEDANGKKDKIKKINYSFNFQYTEESDTAHFGIYAGPSKYSILKSYKLGFQEILFPVLSWVKIFFWADKWFPPLAKFVLWLLLGLYAAVKDYGIAIIILTILSKIITYPLTHSSMKSMNRMRDLQPKINALRNKHKSNPKKMNEEIMALYKAEGVNPLNPGCLPMFLQMPVFISLFIVLQRAIELRGAGTVLLPWVNDLSKPEIIFQIPGGGLPFYGDNFAILPIINAIMTFFQQKMTIKDPNQKALIYFMPIFMLVIFNGFPSGLVLYWTMQSALGLVQQIYTDHKKKNIPQSALPKPTVRKK